MQFRGRGVPPPRNRRSLSMSTHSVSLAPAEALPLSIGETDSRAVSPAQQTKPDGRCNHLRTNGKRCSSLTYPGHASLCHYHLARELRGISDGDLLAADILNSIGNFQSAAAINLALGKIFIHQVTGRLS